MMTDKEVLLLRRKLDLLLRTGKLLMESAADTNRIERNMKRVAAFMGIPEEKLHIDIRWTMIMVNVSDERNSFSKFQKCEKHGINMTAISQVSKLSWRAIEQDYSLDKYEEELEKIVHQPRNYTPYIVAIGRDSHAEDSVSYLDATGWHSYSLPFALSSGLGYGPAVSKLDLTYI